jgi:hypothetical protein
MFVAMTLCLFSISAQQTDENYIQSLNGSVIFQKVYTTTDTINLRELIILKLKNGPFKEVDTIRLTAKMENYIFDIRKFNASWFEIAPFVKLGSYYGSVKIDIKENRYRATLSNIFVCVNQQTNGIVKESKGAVEVYLLNRNGVLRDSNKNNIKVLNVVFADLFDLQSFSMINTEW